MVLPSTIVFDYPSIEALAAAIASPAEGMDDEAPGVAASAQDLQRRRSSFSDLFKGRRKSLSGIFAHR